jgi:hypothetical protein
VAEMPTFRRKKNTSSTVPNAQSMTTQPKRLDSKENAVPVRRNAAQGKRTPDNNKNAPVQWQNRPKHNEKKKRSLNSCLKRPITIETHRSFTFDPKI